MNIVSFGGGVNSTAMLIGMRERNIAVDLILFADTGGEKPETYDYKNHFDKWLRVNGMPPITTVRKVSSREGRFYGPGTVFSLEEYCLGMGTLPSVAYGYKTCSAKFKREPQVKFIERWMPAWADWLCGRNVIRMIGFDADKPNRVAQDHPDLLERALAIERNAPTHGSIRGLGRDYSWQQILAFDAAQGSFFPRQIKRVPCECYEGSEA